MTMHVIREDAPGHDVTATEAGWSCQCGAGNQWTERPRVRAVAAGKRHLAAIAREGNGRKPKEPEAATDAEKMQQARDAASAVRGAVADPNPVPEPAPWEQPAEDPAPTPAPAPVNLLDQFRSPPREASE